MADASKPAVASVPTSALLAKFRAAGFHGDQPKWMALLREHGARVTRTQANMEWTRGRQMKREGLRCSCDSCKGLSLNGS